MCRSFSLRTRRTKSLARWDNKLRDYQPSFNSKRPRGNSNMHDLFAVVESEGVDLLDGNNNFDNFNDIRSDAASLLSRDKSYNSTFFRPENVDRTASVRISKENL